MDASERAAGRGYNDLLQDIERDRGYAYTDTFDPRIGSLAQLGRDRDDTMQDLGLGRDRSIFDLTRSRDRGVQDIGTSRTRGEEDYGRSVEELGRNYRFMGNTQRQQQAAAGVRGGAGAQAARKRTANEAFDRVPLDRGIGRLREDLSRDELRLGEDFTTQTGRVHEDYGIQSGRVNRDYGLGVERETTNFGRQQEGFGTQQTRAGRELGEYRLDTNAQRFFQAGQGGYEPPTAPANERTKHGMTFRVGGEQKPLHQQTYTLPSGKQFNRKQWVGFIRRRRNNGGMGG